LSNRRALDLSYFAAVMSAPSKTGLRQTWTDPWLNRFPIREAEVHFEPLTFLYMYSLIFFPNKRCRLTKYYTSAEHFEEHLMGCTAKLHNSARKTGERERP
jgi:hypothetical protein